MTFKVRRVETWVAKIEDKPGGLAEKLTALAAGGVNLEFVLARRTPETPGGAVVFVSPIKGAKATKAARHAGFDKAGDLYAVRVEGPDRKGQGARIAAALSGAGLNLRGFSAAAIGKRFVSHIALDTAADAARAARLIKAL